MATYVLMFVNDESFRDRSKDEVAEMYADITRWSEDLERKGVLKGGVELQPTRTATTVRRVNGTMRVSDGPFVESKEHVGGFAMIEVPDLDRSEEHTSELQSLTNLVCRLLLEKKKQK